MFTALGRTTVLIRDYDEALAFWRDTLGFTTLYDEPLPDGERYVHVGVPGQGGAPPVGLWLLRASGEDEALVGRQAGGQPLLVLYSTDCRGTVAELARRGVRVRREPVSAGGATFAHLLDLYGNEFLVVELHAPPS